MRESFVLFPLFLVGGLLAPGWLLGRALGASAGLPGALLGSAALLLHAMLALDALHAPGDKDAPEGPETVERAAPEVRPP